MPLIFRFLVVQIDIKSVSDQTLAHVKFDFQVLYSIVCKETAFVIHVHYIYITITLGS